MPAEPKPDPPADVQRELVLKDFLRALKISFKNASIYNLEHPAFISSVNNLKELIDRIFEFRSPFSISFTPKSLFLDDRFWEGEKIYQELGRLFHFRKIKTMEIRPGITFDELINFSSKVTLPLQDFFREGGASVVIKNENIRHITVEELDYHLLLKGEGEEIADVWSYLMEEGVAEQDPLILNQVTESFEHVIGKFNTEDLIKNEELQRTFSNYFTYLKDSSDDQYRKCAKSLVKAVVTNRKLNTDSKFENLKLLISDLREEDLASSLWEEIISDDTFDSLSFSIFSKLIEKERHLEISTSLRDLFQSDDPVNRQPEVEAKIKALLSGTSSKFISEIYQQTLSNLLQQIDFGQKLTFDHSQLRRNCRYVFLNILEKETTPAQLLISLGHIQKEWNEIVQDEDFAFLRCLLDVLQRKEQSLSSEDDAKKIIHAISEYCEMSILEEKVDPELEYVILSFEKSVFDVNTYLERIFTDEKMSALILKAYFKYFTEYLFYFDLNFKQKAPKPAFLEKTIEALKTIDTPMSLVTLKSIYAIGNHALKLKVLQAMHFLSEFDAKFLFSILKTKDLALKGEALALLMRSEATRNQALNKLFDIQSPYGIKNGLLIKHVGIVDRKNLSQSRKHLHSLTKRGGFWNRRLRGEAARVLEKWDAR
ncbi:MAG: hypothetical protein WBB73_08345 [Candidatus Aminicenantaceae bacterium]